MPNINAAHIHEVRLQDQGGDPAAPAAGYKLLYVKAGGVYVIDESSVVTGPFTNGISQATGDGRYLQITNNLSDVGLAATARTNLGFPSDVVTATINFVIDGGGAEIPDGVAGDIVIDFDCDIVAWTLLADISGAIKIDIWKDVYANYPPTDADTITNAHEPEIAASGVKAQDTNLSDWITNPPTITAGDTLRFNVDSCTDITRCTIGLKVQRT